MKSLLSVLILATLTACEPQGAAHGRYQFIHPTGGTSVLMGDTHTGTLYGYSLSKGGGQWEPIVSLP